MKTKRKGNSSYLPSPNAEENRENDIKLSDAIERCYTERWQLVNTGKETRGRMLTVLKLLGNVWLTEIDKKAINNLKNKLRKRNIAPSTINRYLAHLKTLLNMAFDEWDAIAKVPKIKLYREKLGRIRVVSKREEDKLLHILRTYEPYHSTKRQLYLDIADLVEVLVETGMRIGEAVNIKYGENIDLEDNVIQIFPDMTKGATPRCIPLSKRAKTILISRKHCHKGRMPFKLNKAAAPRIFIWAKKKMGLSTDKEFVPHALRHTFASRLLSQGASLYKIKDLLGHSSIVVTERYSHLQIDQLRETISLLDDYEE